MNKFQTEFFHALGKTKEILGRVENFQTGTPVFLGGGTTTALLLTTIQHGASRGFGENLDSRSKNIDSITVSIN